MTVPGVTPEKRRPVVLVFLDYYLPGVKAGGPIRSIANMVEMLGDDFEFRVVTEDRDLGDPSPYASVVSGMWHTRGRAYVYYVPAGWRRMLVNIRILQDQRYDMVYLNSFFSRPFAILVAWFWRFRLLRKIPLLIAPRGEFGSGALKIKRVRKSLYIAISSWMRIYEGAHWHASSHHELTDIERSVFPGRRTAIAPPLMGLQVTIAPDLIRGDLSATEVRGGVRKKDAGSVNIAFIARIVRIKNLDFAIECLNKISGNVQFDIYGPIEDDAYWRQCVKLIKALKPTIRVTMHGSIPHEQVAGVLSAAHIYFLPSKGENFGHGILEALAVGCPVLISDQTFWRDLRDHRVGWDLSLSEPLEFSRALQEMIDMNVLQWEAMSTAAVAFARRVANDDESLEANRGMFNHLLHNR